MKLKDRIKTYNFWVSLSSAIFLTIKVLGSQLGFSVDASLFSDLITSICSILVILGIIVPPKNIDKTTSPEITINSEETPEEELSNNQEINNTPVNDEVSQNLTTEAENSSTESSENNINIYANADDESIINSEVSDYDNTKFCNKLEDISLESANTNTENLDNLSINSAPNNKIDSIKLNLINELKTQEEILKDNIDEYIKILENKLDELKSK